MASLTPSPFMQFFATDGTPLVGGLLYTYNAGTVTPLATYTDSTGATANTNPVVLDSRGEAAIWLGSSLYYMVLKTSTGTQIWTADNVGGVVTLSGVQTLTNKTFVSPVLGAATATSINFGGSSLSSYISSSFTGTLTGVTATVTGTVKYVKVGDIVTISVPTLTGTSNAITKTITGMPAAIRPAATKRAITIVTDNGGSPVSGEVFIYDTGIMDFYITLAAGAWTGSGAATVAAFDYTYVAV